MSYPRIFATPGVGDFAEAVDIERQAQWKRWGDQHHPDGTENSRSNRSMRDRTRKMVDDLARIGKVTWKDIAEEEWREVKVEEEWPKLREELVQLSSVLAAWIFDGDRRHEGINE